MRDPTMSLPISSNSLDGELSKALVASDSQALLLEISKSRNTVHLRAPRRVDFALWRPLLALCKRRVKAGGKACRWVIDFGSTVHVHDSGLATLLAFRRWVQGHRLQVRNAQPALRQRLFEAGLRDVEFV